MSNGSKVTPKDFFVWVMAMIGLYSSVFSLLALLFAYIENAYPDPLTQDYYYDPYSGPIRFAIATLFVMFPLFLGLMRLIRRDIDLIPEKKEIWVRRWAIHLTLFIAGLTIIVDLITLINTFLGGDLTIRFGLKVLAVLLVAGGGFLHFLAELWGFWGENKKKSIAVTTGAITVVVATIAAGFFITGSPWQIRMYRYDMQKVSDLQAIQWQIVNYWQTKEKLPTSLDALNDPLSNYTVPLDPQTKSAYEYATTSANSFRLCANFNDITQDRYSVGGVGEYSMAMPTKDFAMGGGTEISNSWWHGTGKQCFDRTIDPQRYPFLSKLQEKR